MNRQPLTSPDNPRIKAAVKLREAKHRKRSDLFIAEGVREIERAVKSGIVVREVFCCEALLGNEKVNELIHAVSVAEGDAAAWFDIPQALLTKITYRENPEGIVAVCAQRAHGLSDLPARFETDPLILVAAGSTKPGNLGAMLRSGAASGCHAVIAADPAIDLYNPNCLRAGTGALFDLAVARASATDAINWLKDNSIAILAADPDATVKHHRVDWTTPSAIVIGAEDAGLDETWRDAADQLIGVDMDKGMVDSLNASVTAGVILFEARRQRMARGGAAR